MDRLKGLIFKLLNQSQIAGNLIYTLIVLNIVSIILSSYNEIRREYGQIIEYFEIISVIVFTFEYLGRLWTSDLESTGGSSISKRMKFAFSFYGIIDLFAILPFYLPVFFHFDLRILRIFRLFRLVRVLKLGRLSKSFKTISQVLKETKSDLAITLFVAFILLIFASTLMYYVESDSQPEKFENIGQSLWWAVATLTTVGYGDVFPITPLGKVLSAVIALIGIGFIALPTGIISSAFVEKVKQKKYSQKSETEKCTPVFNTKTIFNV